jgi:SAM-dependent methyltransferase
MRCGTRSPLWSIIPEGGRMYLPPIPRWRRRVWLGSMHSGGPLHGDEMTEKGHWYDGLFFDLCVAPNQDGIFAAIRKVIPPGGNVLDVGCGTGRLAFQLAGHSRLVHGVDPSARNIRLAQRNWERRGSPAGLLFTHGVVSDHLPRVLRPYDDAILSYVLHEVEGGARLDLLRSIAARARRLIVADYRVPRARGIFDVLTEAVEFAAGRDHYRGFRSFVRNGGLTTLVQEAGLELLDELPSGLRTTQILLLKGRG